MNLDTLTTTLARVDERLHADGADAFSALGACGEIRPLLRGWPALLPLYDACAEGDLPAALVVLEGLASGEARPTVAS